MPADLDDMCRGATVKRLTVRGYHAIINDLDDRVMSFWRAVRDHGPELKAYLDATPYAETGFGMRQAEGIGVRRSRCKGRVGCHKAYYVMVVSARL